MERKPWEINPDLTKERILAISNLIAGVRGEVIDLHDEDLGDSPLSLGIRAYECCRNRIIRLANSGLFPWINILTPEGRFTFSVGNTPVRFTRNDPESLPERKMIVSKEARRQSFLFEEMNDYEELIWFIVFDTNHKSPADDVYCVGYDKFKNIVCQWNVPIEDSVPLMSLIEEVIPQAVEIEDAKVKLKSIFIKKEANNEQ